MQFLRIIILVGMCAFFYSACGKGNLSLFAKDKVDPDILTHVNLFAAESLSVSEQDSKPATLFRYVPAGIDRAAKSAVATLAIVEGEGRASIDGAFVHIVSYGDEALGLVPYIAPGEVSVPLDRVSQIAASLYERLVTDQSGTALVASATLSSVLVLQFSVAVAEKYDNSNLNDALFETLADLLVRAINQELGEAASDDYALVQMAHQSLRSALLKGLANEQQTALFRSQSPKAWILPLGTAVAQAGESVAEEGRKLVDQWRTLVRWVSSDDARFDEYRWLIANLTAQNLAARLVTEHEIPVALSPLLAGGALKAVTRISPSELKEMMDADAPLPSRVADLTEELTGVAHEESDIKQAIRRATCWNFEEETQDKTRCEANGWNWFVDDLGEQLIETCDLQGLTSTKEGCQDFCDLEWQPSQCSDFYYCGSEGGHDPLCS